MMSENTFTPALGKAWLTPFYDVVIAILTREEHWRRHLVQQIGLQPGDKILDIGCGTGSLAILLKKSQPLARIIGLDPDTEVLIMARKKAAESGSEIEFLNEFLSDEAVNRLVPMTKITSSLVLHQTPLETKQQILNRAYEILEPGGELHIADYGRQRTTLMRILFRMTVQVIDGRADTQPNADGVLPELIATAGFSEVEETETIRTPTGSISLYRAVC